MYNLYLKTIREERLENFACVLGHVTTSNVTERKTQKNIEIQTCPGPSGKGQCQFRACSEDNSGEGEMFRSHPQGRWVSECLWP